MCLCIKMLCYVSQNYNLLFHTLSDKVLYFFFLFRVENMPFGLSNFGSPLEKNICFINAVLQLLYSVSFIRNLVKEKAYKTDRDTLTPISDEVSRIFGSERSLRSANVVGHVWVMCPHYALQLF